MHFLLALICVVGFPALAARVARRGGPGALVRLTTAVLGLVALCGLALASPRFGNRLAATQGYGITAARVLLVLGLAIAFPVVVSATVVHLAGRAGRSPATVYGASVASAVCAWVLGVLLLFAIAWS